MRLWRQPRASSSTAHAEAGSQALLGFGEQDKGKYRKCHLCEHSSNKIQQQTKPNRTPSSRTMVINWEPFSMRGRLAMYGDILACQNCGSTTVTSGERPRMQSWSVLGLSGPSMDSAGVVKFWSESIPEEYLNRGLQITSEE